MPHFEKMERKILKFIKVGREEHMNSFIKKGEMYFDTVESFIRKDKNQDRFDDHEGAVDIKQVDWIKIQTENGDTIEFSKTNNELIKLSSAYVLTHSDSKKGNIYCCSAITPETKESFKNLDKRFRKFGDTLILIEKPKIFLDRVEKELNRQNFNFEIGLVHYYDPKKEERPLSIFNKKNSLSYQNEARIWIKNSSLSPIKIYIGPINDFVLKFKVDELIKKTMHNK